MKEIKELYYGKKAERTNSTKHIGSKTFVSILKFVQHIISSIKSTFPFSYSYPLSCFCPPFWGESVIYCCSP